MPKIMSKKERIIKESKRQMLCTRPNKREHCLSHCFHGTPHEKESGKDSCHSNKEMCTVEGMYKVTCKLLNRSQREEWIEKELTK